MSEHGISVACGLVLAATILTSCVTTPKRDVPLLQQAARHNQKGLRAEGQKNFRTAEAEFAESYRLYSSVENYHGMVTALINSSRLYRIAGSVQKAEVATVQAVALSGNTPELAAEVWFEMAKICLLQNRVADALLWSEKGQAVATDNELPRMLNLSAEIYLKKGVRAKTGMLAADALQHSRKVGSRSEEANALRTLGWLEFLEKRPRTALEQLTAALAIDKELAQSHKVAADLRALSQVFAAMEDMPNAVAHLQRTIAVALAAGDRKQAVSDLETLGKLQEQSGQKDAAIKTAEQRQRMLQEQK